MKKLLVVSFTLLMSCLLSVGAGTGYSKEVRGVTDDTIKIGVMMGQTGPTADSGIPYAAAAQNYFRYINEAGGVHGRKVKVLVEDERYSIPIAIAAFKKLVYKDEILALLGAGGTTPVVALYRSIEKEKVPTLPVSLAESNIKPQKRYIFIPGGTYNEMMYVLCDYIMNDLPFKKPRIAVVVPDHEAGRQDFNSFVERLEQYGIKLADKEIVNFGAIEATTQVLAIKKANVDCIVIGGSVVQNCNVLLRELKKYSLAMPVLGSWATCTEYLVEVARDAAKNYYGTTKFASWYDEGTGVKLMREITKKYKTSEQKLFTGRLYTAGWFTSMVAAEGMKRAGRDLGVETYVGGIESMRNFDSGGISAPITYGENNHYGNKSWKVYKANVEKKILEPVTDWRDPKQLK
jgi:branched-chain amino acid transport system substrate-binding protein